MSYRYMRAARKQVSYNMSIEPSIERIKKMRGLNCSPSDFGVDSLVWKKLTYNRLNVLSRVS